MQLKRKRVVAIAFVLAVLAAVWILPASGLLAWSRINCWNYDVDIRSGRIRYTRYLCYVQIAHRIEDSALSSVLKDQTSVALPPEWRRVHTFSPGVRHSPHYVYHSAIAQIKEMDAIWTLEKFTDDAKRRSAADLLKLWQRDKGDWEARDYFLQLSETAEKNTSRGKVTDVSDLPKVD